ncbi:MAG: formate dehydrogenase [Sedimenticola sp.]|nr:formate dehydrogenase [Sedimenticola sp.]
MKSDKDNHPDAERREFIRNSLAAGIGAASVMTAPGVAVASPESGDGEGSKSRQQGYRLSRHILDYYRTAAS